jgi:hypothetical protein
MTKQKGETMDTSSRWQRCSMWVVLPYCSFPPQLSITHNCGEGAGVRVTIRSNFVSSVVVNASVNRSVHAFGRR